MRYKMTALSLMLTSSALFAQAPSSAATAPEVAAPVAIEVIDCNGVWQTAQAANERARQLASIKRWKEAAGLFSEAAAGAHKVAAECPAQAKDASAMESAIAADFQRASNGQNHQALCEPALDKAFDAEIKASAARRENRDLAELDKLLGATESAWQAAVNSCTDSYKTRAERSLKSAQKARAENTELLSGGPVCDGAWKNAMAINDLARDAKKAKRWDEAANLYDKAHMAWERVSENCSGSRQQSATQKIEDALLDAHNSEYCGPQWDDANEQLGQLNKAKASGVPFAERDVLMVKTEVLWREAFNLCRGDSKSQAKMTADAIARERGAPLPPNAMTQYGKNRAAPAASAPAVTAAPVKPVVATAPAQSAPVQAAPVLAAPIVQAAPVAKPVAAEPAKPAEPGVIVAGDTIYRGNFKTVNGKITGEGTIEWPNGDVYRGSVVDSVRHGKGRMTWKNGQWQEGDWKDNIGTGKAVVFYTDGNRYEGAVVNGTPQGYGTLVFASGDRYTGNFEQAVFHGRGTYYWKSGSNYSGDWVLGQKHGNGRMTMADGSGWEGEYLNDQETQNVRRFKADNKE